MREEVLRQHVLGSMGDKDLSYGLQDDLEETKEHCGREFCTSAAQKGSQRCKCERGTKVNIPEKTKSKEAKED